MVNTRAITKKLKSINSNAPENSTMSDYETDQLTAWQTENPSEVRKYLKVGYVVHHNQLRMTLFNHNYKKILGELNLNLTDKPNKMKALHKTNETNITNTCVNGSQALELALLEMEQLLKKYNRTMVAISTEDEIFKSISIDTFKEIANRAISIFQVILFKPPKFLQDESEIIKTLKTHHMTPTGGHIGQYRLYLKRREIFA